MRLKQKISQIRTTFWFFFEKLDVFFGKSVNFFKIGKVGSIAVERVSNDIFWKKYLFHLNWGFSKKTLKKFELGKIINLSILPRKRFHPPKRYFSKVRERKKCRWCPAVLFNIRPKSDTILSAEMRYYLSVASSQN